MAKVTWRDGGKYWSGLRQKSLKKNPLKRTAIKKRACKIKKVSKKLSTNQRIYNVLRKDYLIDHPVCECGRKDADGNVCQLPSDDIHHQKGRLGSLLTDTRFWKAVSRECHQWIEAHPVLAKRLGLSLNRLS